MPLNLHVLTNLLKRNCVKYFPIQNSVDKCIITSNSFIALMKRSTYIIRFSESIRRRILHIYHWVEYTIWFMCLSRMYHWGITFSYIYGNIQLHCSATIIDGRFVAYSRYSIESYEVFLLDKFVADLAWLAALVERRRASTQQRHRNCGVIGHGQREAHLVFLSLLLAETEPLGADYS